MCNTNRKENIFHTICCLYKQKRREYINPYILILTLGNSPYPHNSNNFIVKLTLIAEIRKNSYLRPTFLTISHDLNLTDPLCLVACCQYLAMERLSSPDAQFASRCAANRQCQAKPWSPGLVEVSPHRTRTSLPVSVARSYSVSVSTSHSLDRTHQFSKKYMEFWVNVKNVCEINY